MILDFVEIIFTAGFWAATIRIACPLIFATLGELICERAGVLNLGIEGIMSIGAMVGWMSVYQGADLYTGILIAAFVVVQDRKQIHFNSAKWLVIFAAVGIPFGLLLLIYGNENLTKLVLGILIILYSIYSLLYKSNFRLETDHKYWLFLCGFFSGVFGGAYGLNGPPLVIYGNMRNRIY